MADKIYAVARGHKTGVFDDTWEYVNSKYIAGFSGARVKGFWPWEVEKAEQWIEENKLDSARPRGGLVAYVDGSNKSDGSAASYGVLIGEEDTTGKLTKVLHIEAGRVDDAHLPDGVNLDDALQQRNILGELIAAMQCLQAIARLGLKNVTIYHDYEGIGMWATGAWRRRSPLSETYYQIAQTHLGQGTCQFIHVKGHTEVEGNEIADRLAGYILGHDRLSFEKHKKPCISKEKSTSQSSSTSTV